MVWRTLRSSPRGGRSSCRGCAKAGRSSVGRGAASSSREARVSSSESQPPRPGAAPPFGPAPFWAAPFWAEPFWAEPFWAEPFWPFGWTEGASTCGRVAAADNGAGAGDLSARCGAGRAGSCRVPAAGTVSRLRPWRATMRLSSASASIWSTITRRICAVLSAVSSGSSSTPRRSSWRVDSNSCCISADINRMVCITSEKRSVACCSSWWASVAVS